MLKKTALDAVSLNLDASIVLQNSDEIFCPKVKSLEVAHGNRFLLLSIIPPLLIEPKYPKCNSFKFYIKSTSFIANYYFLKLPS